ncbi:MAG TPA: CRTAC1 family protein, partial [Vicinamibacterales bacterium]
MRSRTAIAALLVLSLCLITRPSADAQQDYQPKLAVPETMQPFLKYLEPGNDAFPMERQAKELEARLRELSDAVRAGPARTAGALKALLDPAFRGARLLAPDASPPPQGPFEVRRAQDLPRDLTLDARSFGAELQRLCADLRDVAVAELIITAIDGEPSALHTTIRYDIVGSGTAAYRVEHVGEWDVTWRQNASGWQVVRWTARSHVVSRARTSIFSEITQASLGSNESFRRQLGIDLDSWMATFDSVLTRDSNGHHGVSVGDADGDGLDDVYVAQPGGLPNRLYRNRGDSTFEDITDQAGVGVLDDTASSLFVDVDNDGDEDLVLATATQPLLFLNDGKGHFTQVPDAFRFAKPPQGVLTSISMADYDRDGSLDLYLCVYSYFFGAGEDKAGTPAPYYDARNGPPGVLFRNDGHGHFVEVTKEAGLDDGNDRYHFAAAWGDYDGDGWPDLLVANDFGTKNLYHNLGRRNGTVMFEDVAASAGVLDHGAGMSATFLDYDNDGRLDIYTGNMWTAPGLRVTAAPTFMPDATPEVRALYRHHVRGNSLFRNLGDGRFDDKTIDAHAEMGRWAWSADALDFDNDGWDDLYIVNGMLTRASPSDDLEGFFWRQVVAHSPLTRVPGTPYDDAWRAINQLLIHGSIASHQRNVFLRNDGHGGFDEVSGALGLDLEQDGRSFAVLDIDRDGDPDLVVMAARQAPQLRVFRNDLETPSRSVAVRLVGTKSNRDAVGARVVVQTDRLTKTRYVTAGSGFLSQHSKELLIGLGTSERIVKLTIAWPSGDTQVLTDVALNTRVRIVEGGEVKTEPFAPRSVSKPAAPMTLPASLPPTTTWMFEPFPAPDFSLPDLSGTTRTLSA